MFPAVEISIKGLKPTHIYSVYISVELYDEYRYRYRIEKDDWDKFAVRGPPVVLPHRMIPHPDSHNTGAYFMKKPLSFKTIKMTNNRNTTREDQVHTLLIYVPFHRFELLELFTLCSLFSNQ